MWVWHFRSHEKFELVVVGDVLITYTNKVLCSSFCSLFE